MKQASALPAYIPDPKSGETIATLALANREGLHIRTLQRRWRKGIRGQSLIASRHVIYVTDPCTSEKMSLSALAIRYDLRIETVRQRYHDGLRGNRLIAQPKRAPSQQPQITTDKLPVRWLSTANSSQQDELSKLKRHAEETLESLKATLQGEWLTKTLR